MVTDRITQDAVVVQVAHEALFVHWPRLKILLEENRSFLLMRARAGAACRAWLEHNKDRGFLWWNGQPLDEARHLLTRMPELSDEEKIFIQNSVAEGRASMHRRWAALVAVTLFVLTASYLGCLWWRSEHLKSELAGLRAQLGRVVQEGQSQPYEVIELAQRIVNKDPSDSATWALYSHALLQVRDYDRFNIALQEWERNVAPRPATIDDLRGDQEWQQGDKQGAIEKWSAYANAPGMSVDARREIWRKLATRNAALKQWVDVRDWYTKWIDAEENLDALIGRAKAFVQLHDWDAARLDYERARMKDPSDARVKNFGALPSGPTLDTLYAELDADPRDPARWLALATELTRQRDFSAALEGIDHAIDLNPDSMRLAIEKAHLLWQLNQSIPPELNVQKMKNWTRDAAKFPAAFVELKEQLDRLGAADARISVMRVDWMRSGSSRSTK